MSKFVTSIFYKSFILISIFFSINSMQDPDEYIARNLNYVINEDIQHQKESKAFAIKTKRTRRTRYREKESKQKKVLKSAQKSKKPKFKSKPSLTESIEKIIAEANPDYELSRLEKNDFTEQDGPIIEDEIVEEPHEIPLEDDVIDEQGEFASTANSVEVGDADEEERLCESAPIPDFIRNATWSTSCFLGGPLAPIIYRICLNIQKK